MDRCSAMRSLARAARSRIHFPASKRQQALFDFSSTCGRHGFPQGVIALAFMLYCGPESNASFRSGRSRQFEDETEGIPRRNTNEYETYEEHTNWSGIQIRPRFLELFQPTRTGLVFLLFPVFLVFCISYFAIVP